MSLDHSFSGPWPDGSIATAAYVLGEYGHLIANNPGCAPIDQFHALHSKSTFCSSASRAILLSTYFKWTNLFPEIKHILLSVLDKYRHVLDAELQQRACEYLAIATHGDDDELLSIICDEMPPFPERESALLARLNKKHLDVGDKRTWVIGGHEANRDRRVKPNQDKADPSSESSPQQPPESIAAPTPAVLTEDVVTPAEPETDQELPLDQASLRQVSISAGHSNVLESLAGLKLESSNQDGSHSTDLGRMMSIRTLQSDHGSPNSAQKSADLPHAEHVGSSQAASANYLELSRAVANDQGTQERFARLLYQNSGVLFEDDTFSLSLQADFTNSSGKIELSLQSKVNVVMKDLHVKILSYETSALTANVMQGTSVGSLEGRGRHHILTQIECLSLFKMPPILTLGYIMDATPITIHLKLPVTVAKFIHKVEFDQASFFERWKQIGGPPRECQSIFPIMMQPDGELHDEAHRLAVTGNHLNILPGIDPNAKNLVAAGILRTRDGGNFGCLLRLEPNQSAKVRHSYRSLIPLTFKQLCRLTVRSTDEGLSQTLNQLVQNALSTIMT